MVFILLTFGVGYPPLALLLLLSIVLQTLALQIGLHYHYLQVNKNPTMHDAWNKVVHIEISDLGILLTDTLNLSVVLSCLFILLFILDMTWNKHSSKDYVLLPIVYVLCIFGLIRVLHNWLTYRSNAIDAQAANRRNVGNDSIIDQFESNSKAQWPAKGIEMNAIVNPMSNDSMN